MTDLELLFLVLGVIYLWECGWWARRGAIGFRSWLGNRWKTTQPSRSLGGHSGGFIFAHPLPPLGTLLITQRFPLSLSPEGVLAYVPPSLDPALLSDQTASFVSFAQVTKVEAKGKRVQINGNNFLRTLSPTLAAHLVEMLRTLVKSDAEDRKRTIEKLNDSVFDTRALKRRWVEFRRETQGLRLATNLLFVYLFGLAPFAIWRLGLTLTWMWLVLGLLLCTLNIALQFHRVHKRFYPKAEDERFTHFIVVLLSPASAIRAHDVLSRPLLENFHPLAVAKVFCSLSDFRKLSEQFLREIRHPALPLCPNQEPGAQLTESWSRRLVQSALEKFLRRNGCHPEDLLQEPDRTDPACVCFCPRCQAQFTLTNGVCQDCGGVQLVAFSEQSARHDQKKMPAGHAGKRDS